jgi:hypothetical protein
LVQHNQDARGFAVAVGHHYGAAATINVAFTLVFDTGLFSDECRAWQVRTTAENTLTNFKVDFSVSYREFRLTNLSAHQSGFHSANTIIENHPFQGTADAIAKLMVAMA